MSLGQWETLGNGPFYVLIDSHKDDGKLNYGEIFIPGSSKQEILFSTYVCHPSMANNELSGPIVLAGLIQELLKKSDLHYSYRAIFVPETIGSLVYLSRHLNYLREHLIAGWVLTCVGDEGPLSYIPSRLGDTYADKITLAMLNEFHPDFKAYSWFDRGSDERQFCAPGVDLPVCSVTKTKYGEYPQYHTSLDDLDFVTPRGLGQSLDFYVSIVNLIEANRTPKINTLGEPQLGKRNLYPNTSIKNNQSVRQLMNIISLLDGRHNIKEISKLLLLPEVEVLQTIEILHKNDLLS
jgi:aminopeptidase-like protein